MLIFQISGEVVCLLSSVITDNAKKAIFNIGLAQPSLRKVCIWEPKTNWLSLDQIVVHSKNTLWKYSVIVQNYGNRTCAYYVKMKIWSYRMTFEGFLFRFIWVIIQIKRSTAMIWVENALKIAFVMGIGRLGDKKYQIIIVLWLNAI